MFSILATSAETIPSAGTIIGTLLIGMSTGIGVVWKWFRAELRDCQNDRKELFKRVEALHIEVSALSLRVGKVERDT